MQKYSFLNDQFSFIPLNMYLVLLQYRDLMVYETLFERLFEMHVL